MTSNKMGPLVACLTVGLLGLGLALAERSGPRVLEPVKNGRPLFWTWDKLEPDTLACAWLLQRFAAPGCEIRLLSNRESSDEGTPFDIPLSDLSRTRTKSSFHVIRETYRLQDQALLRMEQWIDEIETGGWDRRPAHRAAEIEGHLRRAADLSTSAQEAVDTASQILDDLYQNLSRTEGGER